tara:strand:+ start:1230 stop:1493 length:264 start_codon:yes stop_codon:yes gene_type:complete
VKPTTKDIIFLYIKRRLAEGINIISSIHIEDSIPKYGVTYHSTSRLPSAYSRAWRSIRENQEYKKVGISLVKEVTSEGNTKVWQIMK